MLMRRCKKCGELFERNSKFNFICEECKSKGRADGLNKRKKTFEEKKLNEKLNKKLKKLINKIGKRKQWKIVEADGNVLRDRIHSKQLANSILREVRLSSREDLQIISY